MHNKLRLAGIAGIASIIFAVLVSFYAPDSLPDPSLLTFQPSPLLVIIGVALYLPYIYGFVLLGQKLKSKGLVAASYCLIAISVLAGIAFLALPMILDNLVIGIGFGLFTSACVVIIGWSVLNLKSRLGSLGVWYGVSAMLSGIGIPLFFGLYTEMAVDMVAFALGAMLFFRAAKGRDT